MSGLTDGVRANSEATPLTVAEYLRYWGNDGNMMFEYPTMTKKMREAADLLLEIARAGVVFEDERVGYVEIQVDRSTWRSLHA